MSAPSFPEPSTFGLNLTDLKSEDWKCDKIYLHHWCLRVGLQLWTQTVQNLNSWQTYWKPGDWQQGWYLTLLKIAIWLSKNCQKLDFFFFLMKKIVIFLNKIAIGNFVEKNDNFCQFKKKKKSSFWQFFDSQMAIFRRIRFHLVK